MKLYRNGKKQVKRQRKGSGGGLSILRKPAANNTDHDTGTEMGRSYSWKIEINKRPGSDAELFTSPT